MSMEKPANNHKVVFITGSSSGIGEQTAYLFAAHGDSLVLTYHRYKDEGDVVAAKCSSLGAKNVLLIHLDLTNNESIVNAVKSAVAEYSRFDILINNAAFLAQAILTEQSFENIRLQIKTNLEGPIKITKECLPYIQESIINIGSNLSTVGQKQFTVYSATKFGIRGLTKSLALEFPNLRIFTVNPSLTATKMGHFKGLPPATVAKVVYRAALGDYQEKSGADINVRDYLYGPQLKRYWIFIRWLKHQLWKLKF